MIVFDFKRVDFFFLKIFRSGPVVGLEDFQGWKLMFRFEALICKFRLGLRLVFQ